MHAVAVVDLIVVDLDLIVVDGVVMVTAEDAVHAVIVSSRSSYSSSCSNG